MSEAIEANVRQSNHIDGIAGIQAIMSSITNSPGTCYFSHKLTNLLWFTVLINVQLHGTEYDITSVRCFIQIQPMSER